MISFFKMLEVTRWWGAPGKNCSDPACLPCKEGHLEEQRAQEMGGRPGVLPTPPGCCEDDKNHRRAGSTVGTPR